MPPVHHSHALGSRSFWLLTAPALLLIFPWHSRTPEQHLQPMYNGGSATLHRLLRLTDSAASPIARAQTPPEDWAGSVCQPITTLPASADPQLAAGAAFAIGSPVAAASEGRLADLQKMHADDPRSIMVCDLGGTSCLLAAVRARQTAVLRWILQEDDVSAEHRRW